MPDPIEKSLKGYKTFSSRVDELVAQLIEDKSDQTAAALRAQMELEERSCRED